MGGYSGYSSILCYSAGSGILGKLYICYSAGSGVLGRLYICYSAGSGILGRLYICSKCTNHPIGVALEMGKWGIGSTNYL